MARERPGLVWREQEEARWMCLLDWLREAVMDEIPGWAGTDWETELTTTNMRLAMLARLNTTSY